MKKLLAFAILVATVISLVGCVPDFLGLGSTPTRGVIEGNVYTNDYVGFTFTKPSSWRFYTDEEIAAQMNMAADQLLGDNFKEALKNNPAIYDMMAVDSATGNNINIVYENLKKSFSSNISVEKYIEALKNQLASVSGMTVTFPEEYDTVKLGDSDFTRCVCTTRAYGITMTQIYYLRKVDGYMLSVIVTIVKGYTVAGVEKMFK